MKGFVGQPQLHRVCQLDVLALLLAYPPSANSNTYTDTHPLSYGQPYFWLYGQNKEHPLIC